MNSVRWGAGHLPLTAAFLFALVVGCANSGDSDDETCAEGTVGCSCTPDGLCLQGLDCVGGFCVDGDDAGETGGTGNDGETTDTSGSSSEGDETSSDSTSADTSTDDTTGSSTTSSCPGIECDSGCVEDPETDNMNCGTCGNACSVVVTQEGEVGACVGGECSPVFTECIDVSQLEAGWTCEEVCTSAGGSCLPTACEGHTSVWFASEGSCLDFSLNHLPTDTPCSTPTGEDGGYARCCCAQ